MRQTETHRETQGRTGGHRDEPRHRKTHIWSQKRADEQTDGEAHRDTERQRGTERHRDAQRHTERHTHT